MSKSESDARIAWLPDLIYTGGKFESGRALVCDSTGTIVRIAPVDELRGEKRIRLTKRALLPGMVNAHSHAFQRVLRGKTENRSFSGGLLPAVSGSCPTLNGPIGADSFWTWRATM